MNQQQYRLLCMDIDGTLLNSAHKLPPANREAVQSAAKNGVTICLMSARPPRAVFPIRDALGVDGPLVCCGGGLILSGKSRMADSRLTRACAQAVLQETQARGIHLSVYRDLDWLIAAEDEWSRAEAQITGVQPTVAPLETLFADWGDAGAHKLLCMGEKSQIDEMLPVLEAKHLLMTLVRSKDEYLEVIPAGAGKDTAMHVLCDSLDITPDEVMALGDHDIDAPLLRAAGLGIAVGNASPIARAAADEVTASCDEDGVAHAIYRHIGGGAGMKYRLLALDLDGTLLNSRKEVTPAVKRALEWVRERGVHVVLSTGRIVGEAAEFARELPCDDLMVTAGGTAIATASDERILQSWDMPCEIGAKVVEAVQSRPVRVMIYVGSKIYINEYSNCDFVANYRVEGFHANKIVVEDIAGEIRRNRLNVTKVYALGEREVLEQALAEIRPLPGLTITSSGSDNFEILPAGADKGRALTRLGEMLGVTPAEMVAIGDSDNDAEMLRAVGMPVAMGNADAALKDLAKYITADCDHDGVAQAVYHLFQ